MPGSRLDGSTAEDRDAALDALANARRRRIVRVLAERDRSLALADLARDVARRERATDEGDDGTPARPGPKTVATQLHHWHLPKLAEAGIVERDADRGTVALVADGAVVDALAGRH